jgi:superoxide dismutase, Cu-Zn family
MRRALVVLGAVALAGCVTTGPWGRKPDATADLMSAGGKKVGTAALFDESGKVRLVVDATGLDPGKHGIHFHAVGMCQDPAFTTAGPHFNPGGKKHGLDGPDGPHAGDLPNLEADKDGKAHYDVTTDRVTLGPGAGSLFQPGGTALVLHAKEDDQKTDPSGNSGDRLACGVIRKS